MAFQDDVYESQNRLPGGSWDTAAVKWTGLMGEEHVKKEAIVPPEGWEWVDEWVVDLSRAVDEEGVLFLTLSYKLSLHFD